MCANLCVCLFYIELTTMNVEYRQKVSSGYTTNKVLHTLNVEDLSHLSSQLIVELEAIRTLAEGRQPYLSANIPRCLTKL